MKHAWKLDENGAPDVWAFESVPHEDYGYHNGPVCTVCLEAFCVNCTPGWADAECEGE